jgi:Lon-like ATP-dependent protease
VRLKNMVTRQRFDWLSIDESRPLPVSIPSMPLSLKVMLVGERESLADFQEMEPELAAQAIYSEYEDTLQFADADTLKGLVPVGMAECAAAGAAGPGEPMPGHC